MPLGDYKDKYGSLTQDDWDMTSPLSSAVSGYTYSPSKGGNDYGPPSPFGNSGADYQQPSAETIASTPRSSSSPGFADWWSKMAPDRKKSLGTGLLSAGLNLMASAGRTSPTPISSIGLLGEAGLHGLGAYQQQEQLNKSDKRDALQNALLGYQVAQQPLHQQILQGQAGLIPAQLKNLEAEASMRKAKAETVGIPTALDTAKTDYYKAKVKEGSGKYRKPTDFENAATYASMTPEQRQQYETYKAVGKKEQYPAGTEDIQKFLLLSGVPDNITDERLAEFLDSKEGSKSMGEFLKPGVTGWRPLRYKEWEKKHPSKNASAQPPVSGKKVIERRREANGKVLELYEDGTFGESN